MKRIIVIAVLLAMLLSACSPNDYDEKVSRISEVRVSSSISELHLSDDSEKKDEKCYMMAVAALEESKKIREKMDKLFTNKAYCALSDITGDGVLELLLIVPNWMNSDIYVFSFTGDGTVECIESQMIVGSKVTNGSSVEMKPIEVYQNGDVFVLKVPDHSFSYNVTHESTRYYRILNDSIEMIGAFDCVWVEGENEKSYRDDDYANVGQEITFEEYQSGNEKIIEDFKKVDEITWYLDEVVDYTNDDNLYDAIEKLYSRYD